MLGWIAYATTFQLLPMLWPAIPASIPPIAILEPFRIANRYGLFAVMTPHRYEIEFQGSNDGVHWTPYPFRYKPQDPAARPRIYAPYQPRFDWNLWFASLGPWQQSAIVPRTQQLLLQQDADVLHLFASNPFPTAPPLFVRTVLWQYWFSTPQQHRDQHLWWRRTLLGTFSPTLARMPQGGYTAIDEPTASPRP